MDETIELEVAEILLELPQLFRRFSFTWGAKKRRSCLVDTPTLSTSQLSSLPSPPSVPESVCATCETEKPKALSPATPLLFSPSESDDKSKRSKRKVSLKRKREECLRQIEELSERRECLKEELKKVKHFYDQQKALNLQLKARKQMLILGFQKEVSQSQWNLNSSQPGAQFNIQDQQEKSPYILHQRSFIMADTARSCGTSQCQYGQKVFSSHGSGLCRDFIPDLNLSVEESLRMESTQPPNQAIPGKSEIKALAAQARLRRIKIFRSKNPNAAIRLRYPSQL